MSDIGKETHSKIVKEAHNPLLADAYNFWAETKEHPKARLRQAGVAAWGTVIGALKDIPNEFCNHPVDTAGKAVVAGATGAGMAALLTTGSPLITGGTLAGGGFLLGAGLKNSWDKACNDIDLSKAMSDVWKSGDLGTVRNSMKIAEKRLGPEGFDYGIGAIAGGASARFLPAIISRFGPKITAWQNDIGRNWITQPDGTKISISRGGIKSTLYPDGTKKTVLSDGHTTTYHPKGGWTTEWPNGVKDIDVNGTREIHYPDGRKVFVGPYGHRRTELPNGTIIQQAPDGDTLVKRADGSCTRKQIEGSIYQLYANGDSLSIDSMGKKLFYSKAEGELYHIMPNGEKVPVTFR